MQRGASMGSSRDPLSLLQHDLLEAFFARTQGFFLTGGAALAGFYLRHRETEDLDLFAPPNVEIGTGVQALVLTSAAMISACSSSPSTSTKSEGKVESTTSAISAGDFDVDDSNANVVVRLSGGCGGTLITPQIVATEEDGRLPALLNV